MTSKLYVHTTLIESPFLALIPDSREKTSETVFEYNARAIVHQGDERNTLWKCCSTSVKAAIQALYFKRMESYYKPVFSRFLLELDRDLPEDQVEPGAGRQDAGPDRTPRQFGRPIYSTPEDGEALLARLDADILATSRSSQREPVLAERAAQRSIAASHRSYPRGATTGADEDIPR